MLPVCCASPWKKKKMGGQRKRISEAEREKMAIKKEEEERNEPTERTQLLTDGFLKLIFFRFARNTRIHYWPGHSLLPLLPTHKYAGFGLFLYISYIIFVFSWIFRTFVRYGRACCYMF